MSLKYEPSSEPLYISAKQVVLKGRGICDDATKMEPAEQERGREIERERERERESERDKERNEESDTAR